MKGILLNIMHPSNPKCLQKVLINNNKRID